MRYRVASIEVRRDPAIDRQPVKREVQSSVPLHTARRTGVTCSSNPLSFSYTRDTLESFEALACNVSLTALFRIALFERFYGGNGYKSTPCICETHVGSKRNVNADEIYDAVSRRNSACRRRNFIFGNSERERGNESVYLVTHWNVILSGA